MEARAILFDLYGTLIHISTDEHRPELWSTVSRFLAYRGLSIAGPNLHDLYFETVEKDLEASDEIYPDVDVLDIYRRILSAAGYEGPERFFEEVAQLFRALSIHEFGVFDDTLPVLTALRDRYKLGLVSDAQWVFTKAELEMTGLVPFFDVIVVSSNYGYRKPDPSLFNHALATLAIYPAEAVYVGDTIERDICGAQRAGVLPILLNRGRQSPQASGRCEPEATFDTLHELQEWLIA